MLNEMYTDMVVVKDPVTVGSYQDILDRDNVRIIWPTSLPDFQTFRDAPIGSVESKLWTRRELVNTDGMNSVVVLAKKLGRKVLNQELVIILREIFTKVLIVMIGRITRQSDIDFSKMRILSRIDEYSRTVLFGKSIDPFLKMKLEKR